MERRQQVDEGSSKFLATHRPLSFEPFPLSTPVHTRRRPLLQLRHYSLHVLPDVIKSEEHSAQV